MYRTNNPYQLEFEDFYLPFGGKLRSDNRWIILSKQIPWQEIEQQYSALFADSDTGKRTTTEVGWYNKRTRYPRKYVALPGCSCLAVKESPRLSICVLPARKKRP